MQYKRVKTQLIHASILVLAIVGNAVANDITVTGSLQQKLKPANVTAVAQDGARDNSLQEKIIQLLKVELSENAKNRLAAQAQKTLAKTQQTSLATLNTETVTLPNSTQLGMNNVPVLDQGIHGTCVTFAVTGVLDAALGKGDYISQTCNLQLGNYLEAHGYGSSGWDGSLASTVISQIEQFGVVNKDKERTVGCGGLKNYPAYSAYNPALYIEPEQYRSMSELVFGARVNWVDIYKQDNPELTLSEVKQALNAGDRLVFALLLPRTELGIAGAVGKHKTLFFQDTWVLTAEVLQGLNSIEAAHEMIITGYDDNAVATDNKGKKHKGLLKLRNSWGSSAGDHGDFYISYDYFKLLAFDVQRISPAR